jgi:hypothetical protein
MLNKTRNPCDKWSYLLSAFNRERATEFMYNGFFIFNTLPVFGLIYIVSNKFGSFIIAFLRFGLSIRIIKTKEQKEEQLDR